MNRPGRTKPARPLQLLLATTPRGRLLFTFLALTLFALALLLPGVGSDFWDRDEAEYAEVAHEALQSGDWIALHLFGKPYAEKPPLSIWLSAFSFRVFGESGPAGRAPHVLLASLCPALLFALGRRTVGKTPGMLAALLLSTSLLFLATGRLLLTDSALLFFNLLAILAIQRALTGGCGLCWTGLAGLSLGLGLLAKGPVAYLAPGLFALGSLPGAPPDVRSVRRIRIVGAGLLGILIALPWYVLSAHSTDGASISSFLLREHLFRFTHAMEGHRGFPLLSLGVLVLGTYPWTAQLLGLVRRGAFEGEPARRGVWAWGLGVVVFFSFSATQLPHYLLPALPAFALLVSVDVARSTAAASRIRAWISAAIGVTLFLAAVFAIQISVFPDLLLPVVYPFAGAAVLALLLPLFPAETRSPGAIALSCGIVALCFSLVLPGMLGRVRGLSGLGKVTSRARLREEPVGGLSVREPSLRYYASARADVKWDSAEALVAAASKSPTHSALVWMTEREAVAFARDRRGRLQVLATAVNVIESGPRGLLELCRVRPRIEKARP